MKERLMSLNISYVLSVSRCSPRPSFLPCSRFLHVPIDDSLSAELLPWIPQALSFIDSVRASGATVLVHCAAGISRSPALTVAYIMHYLDLDLDHAYRFVKERRPSISPNLNFLGQLQFFQSTLKPGAPPCTAPKKQSSPKVTPKPQRWDHPPSTSTVSVCDPGTSHKSHTHCVSVHEKRKILTLSLTPLNQGPPGLQAPLSCETQPCTDSHSPHKEQSRCSRADHRETLSPLSLTLNRLLSWGERWLLAAPVRMGQPPLPYGC